ncbi:MAG: DNA primase [Betaproteobacteria bacterium]|nr:DNA primase [Betaproteobacteria bacterium]
MIPDSFKQDLLNRVDIVDVVSRYVQLKRAGANHLGLCPFHTEKTPSFTVSAAKQFYHCFGCGAHGNAIGFLMAYSGLGYVEAVKELAAPIGMQVPEWQPRTPEEASRKERESDLYAVMEKAMDFYRAELKKSPRAVAYLKGRGLSGEIAARFRIGYAPDDWQGLRAVFPEYDEPALVECGLVIEAEGKRYDRFRDRVVFPIYSARGAVIGFGGRIIGAQDSADPAGPASPKYLNSPETPLFEKGRELYGVVQAREAIRTANRILVVEGYMDVVALAQFGIGYAVATLGTATTPVHVSKLLRLADELVFCFDGDAAGRKAAWRALETSLPLATDAKAIRFLFLPEAEDPDSYVRKHGPDALERLAREAQTLSSFLLGELRAPAELASAEGRSRFLTSARPHLQKITAPALRLQLVKAVAELARVSQEEAERLLEIRSVAGPARPAPPKVERSAVSLEWKLLTHLFARPSLASEIDPALLQPERPESQALSELIEILREVEDPDRIDDAMLAELIRNARHSEMLARAHAFLRIELKLEEDAAVAAFRELLEALRKREPEEHRRLREKVLKGTASPEELSSFEQRSGFAAPGTPLK